MNNFYQQIFIAMGYLALGLIGQHFVIGFGVASLFFPAAGFAVAIVLWSNNKGWPGILLGATLFNLWSTTAHGFDITAFILALTLAAASTAQAVLARALVLRIVQDGWRTLENELDIFRTLLLAGPVASLFAATIGALALAASGTLPGSTFAGIWWQWWLGDSLSVLVFLPLCLSLLFWNKLPWRNRLYTLAFPVLLLIFIFALVFDGVRQWEQSQTRQLIATHGQNLARQLEQRFIAHQEALSALGNLVEVNPDMTRSQFEHFTKLTLQDNPDLSALSINYLVPLKERARFEQRMKQRNDLTNFKIKEKNDQKQMVSANDRPEYVSIGFIAPFATNQAALGYDINSESKRRDAIERARLRNASTVTAPVQLVQDNKTQAGVLVLNPIHQSYQQQNKEATKGDISGFSVGVIKVGEMVDIATRSAKVPGLFFNITDESEPAGENNLFAAAHSPTPLGADYETQVTFKAANRVWTLHVFPTEDFLRQESHWMLWIISTAGLSLIALLEVLLLLITGKAAMIEWKVKEQTRELDTSRATLRTIIDESLDMIYVQDIQGRFILANRAVADFYGCAPADLIGKPEADINPRRDDVAWGLALNQTVRDSSEPQYSQETLIHGQTGLPLHYQTIRQLLKTPDGETHILVIKHDVTELQLANQSVRENERRYEYAMSVVGEGLWDWDIAHNSVTHNRKWFELFGIVSNTLQGNFDQYVQMIHPDDLARVKAGIDLCLTSAEDFEEEYRIYHPDGNTLWVHDHGRVVERDSHGRPLRMVGCVNDISLRKHHETNLIDARVAAESANIIKSQFLATISHEIRTPMYGVLGMTELVLESDLTPIQREHLELAYSSGQNLLELINDILDYTKIEANKMSLERVPFSLQQTLRQLIQQFRLRADKKGIALTLTCADDLPPELEGDPTRLAQIVSNFVSNAIKFTETGAITVNVSVQCLTPEDALLAFRITDTGIGIPPERQEAIFSPFTQADNSTNRRFGGTGLGLAIAKELIEMMNGTLSLESTPGVGSTFTFTAHFGISQKSEQLSEPPSEYTGRHAPTEPVASPAATQKPMRILLAEDNRVNQRFASKILHDRGHHVVIVEDGVAAVEAVLHQPFDVILMDIEMPVMDGIEATRAIRNHGIVTPIIGLSGHAIDEFRLNSLGAGMNGYLTKPISGRDLISGVDRILHTPDPT